MENKNESSLEYALRKMNERKQQDIAEREIAQHKYYEETGQKERSWQEKMYVDTDHPNTVDNVTATIWYIIIMLVGAVFNDRWLIWIIATIIWRKHINRKSRRQKEWDEKHTNGGNK